MVPSAITGAVVSVLSLFVFLHPVKKMCSKIRKKMIIFNQKLYPKPKIS